MDSLNGSNARFPLYPGRAAALGEIHARPSAGIEPNQIILHYAFMSEGGHSVNYSILKNLSNSRGESGPDLDAGYFEMGWGSGILRWERHSEFSTYMWAGKNPKKFREDLKENPFGSDFGIPGSLVSGSRVEVRPYTAASLKLLGEFDQSSLCVTQLEEGNALLATDFRQNTDGQTVFLLLEKGLSTSKIGVLVKSAIEMETYRTLAMLGLPLAQSLSKEISKIELELAGLTSDMRTADPTKGRELLDQISKLAADLEAGAVASLFRFGASRAYGNIVSERVETLGSSQLKGYREMGNYLIRRLAPALRTCQSVEERQANLSRKLARAANLLRTRIEVEIEEQNRNLLHSMNKRASLQLRLQQTVEGLSVAAVSYYVVGLFYYMIQAFTSALPLSVTPKIITGVFVPIAVLMVWWTVRRIRIRHAESEH